MTSRDDFLLSSLLTPTNTNAISNEMTEAAKKVTKEEIEEEFDDW